ncbi:MAG: hypothetical protein QOJ99_2178 [Bryobacterales bacterium]|jgi:hypothetical protein|nr:hypothetical protein [Bryobacterales bacterium]
MRLPESTLIIATFLTGILVANYLVPRALQPPPDSIACGPAIAEEN